ncbi:MAG: threonine-phosphate decarboxylase CobD [Desulfuromonadales bacterium]
MNPEQHGGDIHRAARELGRPVEEILDFSASINPLGMPPEVRRAAIAALSLAEHYPEPDAASLTHALAAHLQLPPSHLLPGSGSTELLYLFPRVIRPRRVLLVTPAFGEYARALRLAGTRIDTFPLAAEEDFRLDPERLLACVQPEHDLVLLANPGNPTGVVVAAATIEKIAVALRDRALLAVDEAFIDFCPEHSVISRVPAHANLYVFRSLTKFYAIPGLRAGYLAGPAAGMDRLAAAAGPWRLSTPALAAGIACLSAEDYRRRSLSLIPQLREQLRRELRALDLPVYPAAANFLLIRAACREQAAAWIAALRASGILVRGCANFPPLDGRYFRVAVRSAAENSRLVTALRHSVK